jgi:hypothetical protein
MKTEIIISGVFLLLISCNNSDRNNNTSLKSKEDKAALQSKNTSVYDSSEAIFKYSFNQQSESFEIKQMRPVNNDTLSGEILEKITNKTWPKVQVKYNGTSNDTAFVSIPFSTVLTQQMGSAGAESFMVSTTWTFTLLKGIQYISFDFAVGDHAMPGVYSRDSWEINKNK